MAQSGAIQPAAPLRFGRVELNLQKRQLLIQGQPAELSGRAFDVLKVLADARGRLVAKAELMDAVWPDTFVEENNLQKYISTLRKLLGPEIIVTVPGRGYRLAAEAPSEPPPAVPPPEPAPPPGPPPPAVTSNLPDWLPPLYGRAEALSELVQGVREHRFTTLTGSGGLGKTRLALAAAFALRREFADGAWLVELDAVADPAQTVATVARALGMTLPANRSSADHLAHALADHELLVVLDNCEHLLGAIAPLTAALLNWAPRVRILATSREPIRSFAEHVVRVPPLALPRPDQREQALEFGAIELFVTRAREADLRFALDRSNRDAIIELCTRLDGIALAIELAAARVTLIGLDGVMQRLEERFRLLTGARPGSRRHQTLRATFDWSYELLAPAERTVFQRLGVFSGTFALASAQQVAGGDGIDEWEVLDHLGALVDKSLVMVEAGAADAVDDRAPRYRLLESARDYALEQLAAAGGTEAARQRHAADLAVRLERAALAAKQGIATALFLPLEIELNNLRSALHWAAGERGDRDLALRLAGSARWLWLIGGISAEGIEWYARLAPRVDASVDPAVAARFWFSACAIDRQARRAENAKMSQRAFDLFRMLGDRNGMFWTTCQRANAFANDGDDTTALRLVEEARALAAGMPPLAWAVFHNTAGIVDYSAGRLEAARTEFAAGADIAHASHDHYNELANLANVAELDYVLDDAEAAAARGRVLVELARASRRPWSADIGFINLAAALADLGQCDEAEASFREGLRYLRRNAADRRWTLDHLALLAARRGQLEASAQIAGYADHLEAAKLRSRDRSEVRSRRQVDVALRAALDPAELARLLDEGTRLGEAAAFELGLPRLPSAP